MRFSRPLLPSPDAALGFLAAADRAVVAIGRTAHWLAFAGLIATGLYLEFHPFGEHVLPYAAIRGLHWLMGLVLLIAVGWRLCDAVWALGRRAAGRRRKRRRPPARPRANGWETALAVVFWAVLAVVLVSGAEGALAGRYGLSLLPVRLPLPWQRIHGVATYYLLAVLLLRGFLWSRAMLGTALPYLRRP